MTPEQLKMSILQYAIQGKLVEQREEETPVDLSKIKHKKTEDMDFVIPLSWETAHLETITNCIASKPYQIVASEFKQNGLYPVISQSKEYVIGYNDDKSKLYHHKNPVVIFGDHTTEVKYIDFDFIVGADGIKIFESLDGIIIDKFLKYVLEYYCIGLKKIGGYTRHYKYIKDKSFPLPPLEEQHRIVAKIDELLPLVDKYAVAYEKLEQLNKKFPEDLKKSILQYAIHGKLVEQRAEEGTAEELYEQIQKEKEKLIKEKKIKKEKPLTAIVDAEIPFDIPESWKWVRFGEITDYHMGKTPPRAELMWWDNDIPWVAISDMVNYGHVKYTKEMVSQIALEKKFGQISRAGTLLMSFKLTVGRTSILDIDAVHNEAIISIFPYVDKDCFLRDYFFHILPITTQWGDSKKAIKGETLNSTSIANLIIPLPPLEEQHRIVAKIEELLPLCDKLIK